ATEVGCANLIQFVESKQVVELRTLTEALEHARCHRAELAKFCGSRSQTFIAYRPVRKRAGHWYQSVYSEIDGIWINDQHWARSPRAPGDECDRIAMLIREEANILKYEAEEAAKWAASHPPRAKSPPVSQCH